MLLYIYAVIIINILKVYMSEYTDHIVVELHKLYIYLHMYVHI